MPQITRESTSRPTLSVPSRWARLGLASALPRFCFSGSCGDTSGAASADDERAEQHHGAERRQARARRLVVDAVFARDYPLVQGVVLLIALGFIVSNLLVDLLYGLIDPR